VANKITKVGYFGVDGVVVAGGFWFLEKWGIWFSEVCVLESYLYI
jgi:hypothetical protein